MKYSRIISVVGARPQFVKAAVVSRALKSAGIQESVIHTGQHYDKLMSDDLIAELGLDNIVANFGVGSGSHATQTADIMRCFDQYLDSIGEPVVVMVYGDTNSTLGAGLVAAKRGYPLVHVEAGLRSFNRAMPEEINRVLVDSLADVLFCSSATGMENLRHEGIRGQMHDVGDVMLDAFHFFSHIAHENNASAGLSPDNNEPFALLTLHRASNTDCEHRFREILEAVSRLGLTCVWPIHPRIRGKTFQIEQLSNVRICEPLSYLQTLDLLTKCKLVITDSGGLQKEAYWAKKKCVTLRHETEWTETLDQGWNTLCDPSASPDAIEAARQQPTGPWQSLYGTGSAGTQIAKVLSHLLDDGQTT